MTRKEIEDYLGPNYVVEEVIEDENELYAFFVRREYIESGRNDNYALVGVGPLHYNKLTKELDQLGASTFMKEHLSKEIIKEYLAKEEATRPDTIDDIIGRIRQRRHCNDDEFEFIFIHLGLDLIKINHECAIELIYDEIEYPDAERIIEMQEIFEDAGLEVQIISKHKLRLKNSYV